jgi:hypothetical protein
MRSAGPADRPVPRSRFVVWVTTTNERERDMVPIWQEMTPGNHERRAVEADLGRLAVRCRRALDIMRGKGGSRTHTGVNPTPFSRRVPAPIGWPSQ